MTKREAAIIMAFTGDVMLVGKDLGLYYRYLEELFGRPVQTIEIPVLTDKIRELAMPDFIDLCKNAKEG
ncbi:MAG: hypothetical protein IKF59_04395 [Lachnospiraceae bacterium]|nr:hypothetical protein [Eubacterium sp.]MBR3187262.1 hypothetical protein [Lachnospiraceae bacterium]